MKFVVVFSMIYMLGLPLALAQQGNGMRMAKKIVSHYIGKRAVFKEGFNGHFSGDIKDVLLPTDGGRTLRLEIHNVVTKGMIEATDPDQSIVVDATQLYHFQDTDRGTANRIGSDFLGDSYRLTENNYDSRHFRHFSPIHADVDILATYGHDGSTYFSEVMVTGIYDRQRIPTADTNKNLLEEPYIVLVEINENTPIEKRPLESIIPLPDDVIKALEEE